MAESDVVVHEPDRSRYVLKRGDRVIGETYYDMGARLGMSRPTVR